MSKILQAIQVFAKSVEIDIGVDGVREIVLDSHAWSKLTEELIAREKRLQESGFVPKNSRTAFYVANAITLNTENGPIIVKCHQPADVSFEVV